ncbi:M12 family metallo-peptidase [Chitinophagaceae bacterium MMS25-I14]
MPIFYSPRVLALLLGICILPFLTRAQQSGNQLATEINASHSAGKTFEPVHLFHTAKGNTHNDFVNNAALFSEDLSAAASLYTRRPQAVSITVTDAKGNTYTLEMLQSQPLSANINAGYIDASGRHKANIENGLHYQGSVAGAARSMASMSIFANGDIMMLFANENGNYVIGRLEDGSGNYIFYNDKEVRNRPYIPCGVSDADYPAVKKDVNKNAKTTSAYLCNKVKIYWEVDYQFYTSKGTLTNTQNYITGLFNQFQALYRNEQIPVELKSLYIWTSADPYPDSSSTTGLNMFKAYWNMQKNGFDGDVAHIITKDAHNNGGLGYVDVLCSRSYAYAYSEIYGSYSAVPTYSWDVEVVTHETGHNFGSKHTHWCGWNTGTGGSCGSIDNCYTQEASTGCTTCGETYNKNTGGFTGTIMSYCHLTSIGINLANGFGPLPGGVIRSSVSTSSCLNSMISATRTPGNVCTSDGSVSLTFNTNNFGAAPYTYLWSTGATTQSIFNLSAAGTYNVTVTDSNGCSNSYSTTVGLQPKPGNGTVLTETMPICCGHTTRTITLKASAPQNLSTCQTIAWLRTTTPVASYSAAKTAFAAAADSDILYSTNSSAINASNGAQLIVSPPDSCIGAVTYYYTPFVTRKQKAIHTIADSATSTAVYKTANNITIGSYTVLNSKAAGACDIDTPLTQTLSVTVTGYTGRANKLTVIIQDTNNIVLTRVLNLAGNGTFTIPLSGISGGPLQYMYIAAFDFNCSTSTNCVTSAATIKAVRTVTYDSITRPIFDSSCTAGTSVTVSFAPNACTRLDVTSITPGNTQVHIYPNPASNTVTIAAPPSNNQYIKITDMVGKTILAKKAESTGSTVIDVHTWAKGIYFISVSTNENQQSVYKLVVE